MDSGKLHGHNDSNLIYNEIIAQIKNGNKKNIRITSEKDEREFIDAVINGVGRAEYERNQRVQWGGG